MNDRIKLAIVSGTLLFFVGFVVTTLSMTGSIVLPEHPATTELVSIETIGMTDAFESTHLVFVEFDSLSGLPTNRVSNRPLTIIKQIDETSVHLLRALSSHLQIPKLVLARYRNNPDGGMFERYFEVTLTNVFVVSHTTQVENTLEPQDALLPHMERVTFAYESAEWHWLPDDISTRVATCDWDGNSRVDMKDYAAMMLCASDSNVDWDKCITTFDASENSFVDAEDLPNFLSRLTGP